MLDKGFVYMLWVCNEKSNWKTAESTVLQVGGSTTENIS